MNVVGTKRKTFDYVIPIFLIYLMQGKIKSNRDGILLKHFLTCVRVIFTQKIYILKVENRAHSLLSLLNAKNIKSSKIIASI